MPRRSSYRQVGCTHQQFVRSTLRTRLWTVSSLLHHLWKRDLHSLAARPQRYEHLRLKLHVRPSSSAVLSYLQAVPRALQVIIHSSQFRSHMHGCCCATPNQIRCPVSLPTLWQA